MDTEEGTHWNAKLIGKIKKMAKGVDKTVKDGKEKVSES